MAGFKAPTFADRANAARDAKQKALERLRAKPVATEAEIAEKLAAQQAREAAEEEKRQLKRAAIEEAKAAKDAERARAAEEARLAAELAKANEVAPPTEAEMKAARDARYAARKARKGSR